MIFKHNPLRGILESLFIVTGLFLLIGCAQDPKTADNSTTQAGIALQENSTSENPKDKPYKAHQLTLKDQNGKIVELSKLQGKVVFINFWATWCPPCIAEMPTINKLYQGYRNREDVLFLMVSLDNNFNKAKDFKKENGFDFNIHHAESHIPVEFKTRGIPSTYVLDRNGKIAFSQMGLGNYNTKKFRSLMKKLTAK